MNNTNVAVYCSGSFGPGKIVNQIANVQKSGFTTIILWSMHVGRENIGQPYGELVFNDGDIRITNNNIFNPDGDSTIAAWPGDLAQLKQNGSSVDKIFISMGGDDRFVYDFRTIEYMLDNNMADVIRNNFSTLRTAFTIDGQCVIDGIDIDNEEVVKASTITDFCEILFELGFEVTFCPFSSPIEWQGYMQTLWDKGHRVSWWNLQCYSGGDGNLSYLQPWINALSTVVGNNQGASYLVPGLAVLGATDSTPQQCPNGNGGICQSLSSVSNLGLAGGFVWTYDSILGNTKPCSDSVPTATDYAKAIRNGLTNSCKQG